MQSLKKYGLTVTHLLVFLGLIICVVLAYSNIYGHQFLYDDEFLIQKNELLRSWSGLWQSFLTCSTGGALGLDNFYRPIQGALYTIAYQIGGLDPVGFHVINIFFHLSNVVLVLVLGWRLGLSLRAILFAAALWALHPLHTEAVTYMSATADTTHTFFILLGLWAACSKRIGLALFAFLAALMSKEAAIVFPALAMLVTWYLAPLRSKHLIKTYLWTWPLWLLAFSYLLARATILNFNNTFQFYSAANVYTESFLNRLYTFLATLPSYVRLIFRPHDLHIDRSFQVFTSVMSAPVLVGLLIVAAATRARGLAAFGVLWFAITYLPQSGVVIPVNAFMLEHWLYLPSIGLAWMVGVGLDRLSLKSPSKQVVNIGVTIVALILAGLTYRQNEVWATPVSLYEHILKLEPNVARVHNNLAMAYSDLGQTEKAIDQYKIAISINDTYPQTHHNLGLAWLVVHENNKAIEEFKRALEIDPDFFQAANTLADIYHQLGDPELSRKYRAQADKSYLLRKHSTSR